MDKIIDYARMKRRFPVQKAALTRAVNSGDPDRVLATCQTTVAEWDDIGAWPDDWARWQCALDDAWVKARRGWIGPRLEDMS